MWAIVDYLGVVLSVALGCWALETSPLLREDSGNRPPDHSVHASTFACRENKKVSTLLALHISSGGKYSVCGHTSCAKGAFRLFHCLPAQAKFPTCDSCHSTVLRTPGTAVRDFARWQCMGWRPLVLNVTRRRLCSAYDQFALEHQGCLEDRKALVVKINETRELLLAPVFSIEGNLISCGQRMTVSTLRTLTNLLQFCFFVCLLLAWLAVCASWCFSDRVFEEPAIPQYIRITFKKQAISPMQRHHAFS